MTANIFMPLLFFDKFSTNFYVCRRIIAVSLNFPCGIPQFAIIKARKIKLYHKCSLWWIIHVYISRLLPFYSLLIIMNQTHKNVPTTKVKRITFFTSHKTPLMLMYFTLLLRESMRVRERMYRDGGEQYWKNKSPIIHLQLRFHRVR